MFCSGGKTPLNTYVKGATCKNTPLRRCFTAAHVSRISTSIFQLLFLSKVSFFFPSAGTRISTFTQADLASRSIQYVHSSEEEKHADQFSFTVSDGTNEVNVGRENKLLFPLKNLFACFLKQKCILGRTLLELHSGRRMLSKAKAQLPPLCPRQLSAPLKLPRPPLLLRRSRRTWVTSSPPLTTLFRSTSHRKQDQTGLNLQHDSCYVVTTDPTTAASC